MSPKQGSLSPLARLLDVRGLVTNVAAALIVAVLLFAVALAVTPTRNALQGVVTARIWVWVLVLALIAEAALLAGVRFVAGRRTSPQPSVRSAWVSQVSYGGVLWPVTRYANVAEYKVDPPICPIDKTQLGLAVTDATDDTPIPLATLTFKFSEVPRHLLKFRCLKCSAAYDLSGLGYAAEPLLEIVAQHALGEERVRRSQR